MANALRRMPFAAEVNTLQAEVGCDQHLVTGRNAEHGTVVADARDYPWPAGAANAAANAGDQACFR